MIHPNEIEWSDFNRVLHLPSHQRDATLTAWLGDGWSPFAIQGSANARPMDVLGADALAFIAQAVEVSEAREMVSACGAPEWEQRSWMINALRVGSGLEPNGPLVRWLLDARIQLGALGADLAGALASESARALIDAGAPPAAFGADELSAAERAIKGLAMRGDNDSAMRLLGEGLGADKARELINAPGSHFKDGEDGTLWSSIASWSRPGMAEVAWEWGADINFASEMERLSSSNPLSIWMVKRAPFDIAGRALLKAGYREWGALLEGIWRREDCGGDRPFSEAFEESLSSLDYVWWKGWDEGPDGGQWDTAPFRGALALCEARALATELERARGAAPAERMGEAAESGSEGAGGAKRGPAPPKIRI